MPDHSAIPADDLGALLNSAELAQKLKVDEPYIDWLRRRHDLPWIRVGGEPRFSWRAVSAWIQTRAVAAPAEVSTVLTVRSQLDLAISASRMGALRKHALLLARYRGDETDLLEESFPEVRHPADRCILLAVAVAARLLNEADRYRGHSVLADEGPNLPDVRPTPLEPSEKVVATLDRLIVDLCARVPADLADLLVDGPKTASAWRLVEAAAAVMREVLAIRELCDVDIAAVSVPPAASSPKVTAPAGSRRVTRTA